MRVDYRAHLLRPLLASSALLLLLLACGCDQLAYEMAQQRQNTQALGAAHGDDYQAFYRTALDRAPSNPEMLGVVGFLTLIGAGTLQDPKRALAILNEAANEGANTGYLGIGFAYSYGIGLQPSDAGAAHYYSAIGGSACASMDSPTTSFDRLVLAEREIRGFCHRPANPQYGLQLYRSIENSLPIASVALGYLYATGTGASADPQKAAQYFEAAQQKGLLFIPAAAVPPEWSKAPLVTGSSGSGQHLVATGTAFAVNAKGVFITNRHVIEGCKRITIDGNEVRVGLSDATDDLATLYSHMKTPSFATFREPDDGRPGESVVALGFPLTGLLATQANVTTGIVSATAGLGGDARYLQITAPVQPGNSGGPLLDDEGLVLGIVSAKLDALATAKASGSLPENVNFAIKTSVIQHFAEYDGTRLRTAARGATLDIPHLAAAAKRYTYLVKCWQ
jgi:S1-C subfamily serine protease